MSILEDRGVKIECREGTSDEKTFQEVIVKKAYERREFQICAGERWLDLGGNVGAFTCLASSKGAFVTTVEPDPSNVRMIRNNLSLNGFQAEIIQAAVVHDRREMEVLNLWPDGQSWRNSIVRNRRGTNSTVVRCHNAFDLIKNYDCVKMDIEGSEIMILENWPENLRLRKMVFEYSFDVDSSCARLRSILGKLRNSFSVLKYSKQIETLAEWKFFPPATMVFCTNP